MTTIHVHVPVSTFSVPYAVYLRENYYKLLSTDTVLKFYAHCIDADCAKAMANVYNWSEQTSVGSGSSAHAKSCRTALTMSKTLGGINVIADSDTVILARKWDLKLAEMLTNVNIVGTTTEAVGGFSSGSGKVQMAKELPTLCWFAFDADKHDFSDLETEPNKSSNIHVSDETLSQIYHLPVGFEVLRDVGWQIPQYVYDNKLTYVGLSHEKPTKRAVALKATNHDYHEEYWTPDEVPFVAHQRGSMKHAFRNSGISTPFYNACEGYIATL